MSAGNVMDKSFLKIIRKNECPKYTVMVFSPRFEIKLCFCGTKTSKQAIERNPISNAATRRNIPCNLDTPSKLPYGSAIWKTSSTGKLCVFIKITMENKARRIKIGILLWAFLILSIVSGVVLYPIKKNGKNATVRESEKNRSAGEKPMQIEITREIAKANRNLVIGATKIFQKNKLRRYHNVHPGLNKELMDREVKSHIKECATTKGINNDFTILIEESLLRWTFFEKNPEMKMKTGIWNEKITLVMELETCMESLWSFGRACPKTTRKISNPFRLSKR